jgi:N-acetylglucosaminyldiphosphoundecaprenol N-acetyl-beta-D-mannosaminyltransferase
MSDGTNSVEVLGVRFHALTRNAAAAAVADLARSGGQHYVVKPYSEFMPPAHGDEKLRDVLNGASLCLADGTGILWAAHYLSGRGSGIGALIAFPASLLALMTNSPALRKPLPQAMRGVDFTWAMLDALAQAGLSVFLLGGTSTEVEGTASRIRERLSTLDLRGVHPGHFKVTGRENNRVIGTINAASPDVLLVGMGFPRQEHWIAANLASLNVHVAVAEGGSFSFISGTTPRAPDWMRRAGLEWLYRLRRQPGRLKRQMAVPQFVWLVLRERMTRRA